MQLVWALLKAIEVCCGLCCLGIHINAIDNDEPIQHIVFYCGTFFSFTIVSLYGAICIVLNRGTSAITEVVINSLGAIMHIIAAIWSMHHAETDYHLQYLSDFEEPLHPYFSNCRQQSVASLACGFIYMMHCALACDAVFTRPRKLADPMDENFEATQSLRLYFICPIVHEKLSNFKWFRRYTNYEVRSQMLQSVIHLEKVGDKARLKAAQSLASVPSRKHMLLAREKGGDVGQIHLESHVEEQTVSVSTEDQLC